MAAFFAKLEDLFKNHWYAVTLGILCFPFFCFVLGSLGFLVKIPLTKWHGVAAFLLTTGVVWYLSPTKKVFAWRLAAFFGIQFLLLLTSSLHTDHAWDSNSYHKPAVVFLAEGWNPVWQENLADYLDTQHVGWWWHLTHAHHFPKGLWIVTAILYLMTGNINLGDYVTPAFMLALFPIAFTVLDRWLSLRKWETLAAAAIISLNPITIALCFTGMVDGILASTLAMFLLCGIMYLKTGERQWIPWIQISAIFGCMMKHTGPVYFGVIGIIYSLVVLWKYFQLWRGKPVDRNQWMRVSFRGWFSVMFGIFFAVLVLGFHPYVTNTYYYSSPFYPTHSFDKEKYPVEDIMAEFYNAKEFRDASVFQRFVFSHIISLPIMRFTGTTYEYPISKIGTFVHVPLEITNGFSWFFGLAFAVSLGLLFFVRGADRWLILVALAASVAVQPHSWWARFVPQLWLFPILVFCFIRAETWPVAWVEKRMRWLLYIPAGMLLGLVLFSAADTVMTTLNQTSLDRRVENIIRENPGGVVVVCTPDAQGNLLPPSVRRMFQFSTEKNFRAAGMDVEVIGDANHPGVEELIGRGMFCRRWTLYSMPNVEFSPKNYRDIDLEVLGAKKSEIPASLWQTAKLRAWQLKKAWIGE